MGFELGNLYWFYWFQIGWLAIGKNTRFTRFQSRGGRIAQCPHPCGRCINSLVVVGMSDVGSLSCHRGVPGAMCWLAVVVAARGQLVWGCALARFGLAGWV